MNPFDKVTLELNRKITSLEEENAALKEQVAQLGIEFTVYKRATDLAYKGSELETQEQLTTLQSKSAALVDALTNAQSWSPCPMYEAALAAFKGEK